MVLNSDPCSTNFLVGQVQDLCHQDVRHLIVHLPFSAAAISRKSVMGSVCSMVLLVNYFVNGLYVWFFWLSFCWIPSRVLCSHPAGPIHHPPGTWPLSIRMRSCSSLDITSMAPLPVATIGMRTSGALRQWGLRTRGTYGERWGR